jgi:hypothetical protein
LVVPYIMAFVYFFHKKQILAAFRKLNFASTLTLIFFVFFIASSPLILFQPKEYGLKYLGNVKLFSRLSVGQDFSYSNFIANLQTGLLKNTIGISSLIAIIAIMSVFFSARKIKLTSQMYLGIGLVATILLIAIVSVNGPSYFNSYVLPLSIFFPIHLYLLLPARFKNLLGVIVAFFLTGILTLILSLSRIDRETESINSYQIIHERALLNEDFALRSTIEKFIDTYEDKEFQVIQDHTIPTPKTNFDPSVDLNFVYGNWVTAKLSLPPRATFLLIDYRKQFGILSLTSEDSLKFYNIWTQNPREDSVLTRLNERQVFDGRDCEVLRVIRGVGVYRCANG